ncbi:ankyrin repeat-containing domain protein [Aspergillus insuetus]
MGYTTDITPMHIVSLYWNADAIRALMDRCRADASQSPAGMVARADSRGRLPLHWALTRDRGVSRRMLLDTVALLLEANLETVNVPNHRGASAGSQAIETHAIAGGSLVPLLKLLLAHGADARVCDSEGRNLLHQLARASWQPASLDPDLLHRLLEQVGVNDPAAADGSTALHYLVRHLNQIDAARHLIQCGANANATNHQGNTPLHEVMRGVVCPRVDSTTGQLEPMPSERLPQFLAAFIQVLVEAGASMDQLNAAGKTSTQVRDEVTESREMIRREGEAQQLRMRGRGRGRGRG